MWEKYTDDMSECDMRLLNRDRVSCDALQHKLRSGLGVFYVHTVILV